MSNKKETLDETELFAQKTESFIQTYIVVSGLLLTQLGSTINPLINSIELLNVNLTNSLINSSTGFIAFGNHVDIQVVIKLLTIGGDAGFIIFLISILIYKITLNQKIVNDFTATLAFIASFGLSLQIINSIDLHMIMSVGTENYTSLTHQGILAFILLILTTVIAGTLVPKCYYKILILMDLAGILLGISIFIYCTIP